MDNRRRMVTFASEERSTLIVSQDIEQRREQYLLMMHDHGTKSREQIIESVRETQAELLGIFSGAGRAEAAGR